MIAEEDEADARTLLRLIADDDVQPTGNRAAMRWFDVVPLHYLGVIWACIALVLRARPPVVLLLLTLAAVAAVVVFAVALRKAMALHGEIHLYALVKPARTSYAVSVVKPELVPQLRAWTRIANAILGSIVIAGGVVYFYTGRL